MEVLLTGASGFIGSHLLRTLLQRGESVRALLRTSAPIGEGQPFLWNPDREELDERAFKHLDAVVNLAGTNIMQRRWNPTFKRQLIASRTQTTEFFCRALLRQQTLPKVMLSASAIGYYGDRGEELLTETSPAGSGFFADLCQHWEEATRPLVERGVRVVHLRFGLVLGRSGGVVPQMLPPFRAGLGGYVGTGSQYISWIALTDAIGAICHLLGNESISGPVNIVAPDPATNRDFSAALATAVGRASRLRIPAWVARLRFGEVADHTILASARVYPSHLIESQFSFACPQLKEALRHELTHLW